MPASALLAFIADDTLEHSSSVLKCTGMFAYGVLLGTGSATLINSAQAVAPTIPIGISTPAFESAGCFLSAPIYGAA